MLFHIVDDAFAILRCKGVFKQAKIYRRGDRLYAGWSGGFIGLCRHGTTKPDVNVEDIIGVKYRHDNFGRIEAVG